MFSSATASFGPIVEPLHSSAQYFVLAKKQGTEVLLCALMFLCVKMIFAVGLCHLPCTVTEKVKQNTETHLFSCNRFNSNKTVKKLLFLFRVRRS